MGHGWGYYGPGYGAYLRSAVPPCLLLHACCCVLAAVCSCSRSASAGVPFCPKACRCSAEPLGELAVRCSGARLTEVPRDLPSEVTRLALDANHITCVRPGAFRGMRRLKELNLSGNLFETLPAGVFAGLEDTLKMIDISDNRLTTLRPEIFQGMMSVRVRLSRNPWHCDCALQQALSGVMDADPVGEALCRTALVPELAGKTLSRALPALCGGSAVAGGRRRRTTDVAMLLTMAAWFAMVIVYVVVYVRRNQAETRRHLEYLKSLPNCQPGQADSEEADTVSSGL
ncbi:leucine-rich repeat-containing protein 3B-like [Lethenteron reissneri]|uniref:leucine-rich repeat-containing protein 3B-like n=1 Tax=Lethenteron reissneri TaxID=7753 RepID=UPI002AB61952|nr:leucine-rich repeat-containing protein 3B-like [Lethenteron reissneri]XP_061411204.1 leucine-rich repeat-containing protein 3B-like [Lethenteron reissneri]XP_061411205.1 leucine-rich repeat-containing protein 3B-like [Lethenteron reissneri]XP_061411206.1 leucine-rich repeat-containing protein 3B-like [Lethenteron reissneri]XP_061411207.1 leucine-rich repeat-containing protein 3B-like [Lethenteron reissneri]XP_061411208.1 leucine-rich repeat-containing protein 3B-like [Lethenteron reissneri]